MHASKPSGRPSLNPQAQTRQVPSEFLRQALTDTSRHHYSQFASRAHVDVANAVVIAPLTGEACQMLSLRRLSLPVRSALLASRTDPILLAALVDGLAMWYLPTFLLVAYRDVREAYDSQIPKRTLLCLYNLLLTTAK